MKNLIVIFLFVSSVGIGAPAKPAPSKTEKNPSTRNNKETGTSGVYEDVGASKPNEKKMKKESEKETEKKVEKKPVKTKKVPDPWLAIGLHGGYEATYGNAASLHLLFADWMDIHMAAGYNSTGLKAGLGSNIYISMTKNFGFTLTGGMVYSKGRSGEISLDGTFTSEGAKTQEKVIATKEYVISDAIYLGLAVGGYYHFTRGFRLMGDVGYNAVLSGNEVTFKPGLRYDQPVEVTNEEEFERRFREKAAGLVKTGGVGASVGMQLLF